MMHLACPCGAVRLTLAERPDHINECNCSLCRRTDARWAYVHPDTITVAGATDCWSRDDKPEPAAAVHTCRSCRATTHFTLTPAAIARHGNAMMGVNMRLAADEALAGIELRFPDGATWDGAGPFGYVRAPRILGRTDD